MAPKKKNVKIFYAFHVIWVNMKRKSKKKKSNIKDAIPVKENHKLNG